VWISTRRKQEEDELDIRLSALRCDEEHTYGIAILQFDVAVGVRSRCQ
jgi:hypothetical protein